MFIDTKAANAGAAPRLKVTGASNGDPEDSPLLESFVGQDAPPPSYLEATTPMPWARSGRGNEGERLLEDGRVSIAFTPMREEYKDGKYRRRGWADRLRKRRVLCGLLVLIVLIIFGAIIAALAGRKEVCFWLPSPSSMPRDMHIRDGNEWRILTFVVIKDNSGIDSTHRRPCATRLLFHFPDQQTAHQWPGEANLSYPLAIPLRQG